MQILLPNVVLKQQIRRYKILHNKYQHGKQRDLGGKVGGLGASLLMLQICTTSKVQWDVDVRRVVRYVTGLNERSFVSLV